ncbi:MAG: very short patch repair endonuclease [Bacteroidaceae bacterium]|nr:very short patch repair endonuclease [Bacteroidaceae bacterium]
MPDKLTEEQRHRVMAAIRAKNTKPEIIVRKYLWACGFRYRLNHPRLPGKPDIVLRKYRTCVFVNGCFWHGHNTTQTPSNSPTGGGPIHPEGNPSPVGRSGGVGVLESSECCKIPKTNTEFWTKKITRNQERDAEVQRKLLQMGWYSITIWECQLKPSVREQTLASLAFTLNRLFLNRFRKVKTYKIQEEEEVSMVAEDESLT